MSAKQTKVTKSATIRPKTAKRPAAAAASKSDSALPAPVVAAPAEDANRRHPTGANRLDLLLEGGLRRGDCGLVYGPAFLGKGNLCRVAIKQALQTGMPAIVVTTREEAANILSRLELTPEQAKLLFLIDTVGAAIGSTQPLDQVTYLDGPSDLNGVAVAINNAQRAIQGHHSNYLMVIDSLSTLIAHTTGSTVFRFLQVVLGAGRRAGAHSLLMVDDGMHDSIDVNALKHLSSGTVELRDREGKHQVRILGFELQSHIGWIDYISEGGKFDVVGSFAAGRIR